MSGCTLRPGLMVTNMTNYEWSVETLDPVTGHA